MKKDNSNYLMLEQPSLYPKHNPHKHTTSQSPVLPVNRHKQPTTGGTVAPVHCQTAPTATTAPVVMALGGAVTQSHSSTAAPHLARQAHTRGSDEQNNNTCSVMAKQIEITALLKQQQCLSSMPKKEIQVFDCDPLQYQMFMKSFEHSIESKNPNPTDCLYCLEQYTRGQPRELVAYIWLQIEDSGRLNLYCRSILAMSIKSLQPTWKVLFHGRQSNQMTLKLCKHTLSFYRDVVMPWKVSTTCMSLICLQLSYHTISIERKWRTVVCDFQENYNRRATFRDIVMFLEKQVKIITDPVFGDVKDIPVNKDAKRSKSQPHPKIKGSIFATNVTAANEKVCKGTKEKESQSALKSCLFCEG